MKISSLSLVALVATSVSWLGTAAADVTPPSYSSFVPPRLSYQELENLLLVQDDGDDGSITRKQEEARNHLKSILRDVGFFSITNIPGMGLSKPETLQNLIPCVLKAGPDTGVANVASHTFRDGTIRKTLASVPGNPLVEEAPNSPVTYCNSLEAKSRPFRATVAEVTRTVAELLQVVSGLQQDSPPLLVDAQGGKYNLEAVVNDGQHLEHFHIYKTPHQVVGSDTTASTLDWHTDQGLLLIFSPGLRNGEEPTQQDFYVQLPDGPKVVEFSHQDELVVMLGEGVQQYVNPHLKADELWRPVPHSLRVQEGPRAWYGRMVLPPSNALHPLDPQKRTFGDLRQEQIVDPSSAAGIGCGSKATLDSSSERILQETEESCTPDTQQYCWHRCLNFTEEVSPSACAAADATHEVACINSQRQLWTGDHNPDFALGCIDVATADEAPSPAPADTEDESGSSGDGNHTHASDDDKKEDEPSSAFAAKQHHGWLLYAGMVVVVGALVGAI